MAQAAKMDFDAGGRMADEGSDEGRGGGKKLIIIIIAVLVLLGGGAAAYFLVFRSGGGEEAQGADAELEEFAEEENLQVSSAQETAKEPFYFHFRDPKEEGGGAYLVNLIDGRHFLTIKLVAEIEAKDVDVNEYLEQRRPLLDDIIVVYLSAKGSEEMRDPNTQQRIKLDLKRKVNAIFTAEFLKGYASGSPVKRILITDIRLN